MRYAIQVTAGHSTLIHTYSHPDLLTLSAGATYNEFAKIAAAFVSSGVCKRPTLYRPPYGNTNATVAALTGRMGLRGVLWNVDTVDWSLAKTNPTKMLADFKSNLAATGTAGVIHLQHDLLLESVNLVPQVRGQHDGVGVGVGWGRGRMRREPMQGALVAASLSFESRAHLCPPALRGFCTPSGALLLAFEKPASKFSVDS